MSSPKTMIALFYATAVLLVVAVDLDNYFKKIISTVTAILLASNMRLKFPQPLFDLLVQALTDTKVESKPQLIRHRIISINAQVLNQVSLCYCCRKF